MGFESFEHWVARNSSIAPYFNMPASILSQTRLDDEAFSQLLHGAEHPNPKVRWWCAHLADHVADDRCAEALVRLSKDEVPRVRAEALHALGCERCKPNALQVDAVEMLVEAALEDPSEKVRGTAVFTLGFLPTDRRAAIALERIAASDADASVRDNATRALKYHAAAGQVNAT